MVDSELVDLIKREKRSLVIGSLSRLRDSMQLAECSFCGSLVFFSSQEDELSKEGHFASCVVCAMEVLSRLSSVSKLSVIELDDDTGIASLVREKRMESVPGVLSSLG